MQKPKKRQLQISPPRQHKPKLNDLSVQPWQHQQQHLTSLPTSLPIPVSASTPVTVGFGSSGGTDSGDAIGFVNPEGGLGVQHGARRWAAGVAKDKENRRSRTGSIDFVKKNQDNIQNYMQNYAILLNDDLQKFTPMNANNWADQELNFTKLPFSKKPVINTTYIGYYDQQPFWPNNHSNPRPHTHTQSRPNPNPKDKAKERAPARKNWSSDGTRPRTPHTYNNMASISYSRQNSRNRVGPYQSQYEDGEGQRYVYERATLAVSGSHLQKVLKIKEKLRRKLKNNSDKKDIERGMYMNKAMKIHQQKSSSTQQQNQSKSFIASPKKAYKTSQLQPQQIPNRNRLTVPRSYTHKNSSSVNQNSINSYNNNNKNENNFDKWKQYLQMQKSIKQKEKQLEKIRKNQNQALNGSHEHGHRHSLSASQKLNKNNPFFTVFGGAIYK